MVGQLIGQLLQNELNLVSTWFTRMNGFFGYKDVQSLRYAGVVCSIS